MKKVKEEEMMYQVDIVTDNWNKGGRRNHPTNKVQVLFEELEIFIKCDNYLKCGKRILFFVINKEDLWN